MGAKARLARPILTPNARASLDLMVGAGMITIIAMLGSLRTGALGLTVIPKMMQQACLPVLLVPTIG